MPEPEQYRLFEFKTERLRFPDEGRDKALRDSLLPPSASSPNALIREHPPRLTEEDATVAQGMRRCVGTGNQRSSYPWISAAIRRPCRRPRFLRRLK